jgi:hypothetical protein
MNSAFSTPGVEASFSVPGKLGNGAAGAAALGGLAAPVSSGGKVSAGVVVGGATFTAGSVAGAAAESLLAQADDAIRLPTQMSNAL